MRKIAVIPGDGVGIEVTAEAVKVIEAVMERSGLDLELVQFDYGAEKYLDTGITLPSEQIEEFRQGYDAIFIGALGDPRIPDRFHVREILQNLRIKLDLFINYRPVKLQNAKYCPLKEKNPQDVNFAVLRENLEGPNPDIGGVFKSGTPDEEVIQQSIITLRGVRRICQNAFEFARRQGRKKVTICNSRNALHFETDLLTRAYEEVGKEYPEIEKNSAALEEVVREMLRCPENFDVILTCNSFGDIIADLGAELQGGIGIAAEGNLNPGKISMYMPIHGPLTQLVGKNAANPLGAISAAAMMLENMGLDQETGWINNAVKYALDTDNTTRDFGGRLGTRQVGDFVADQIRKGAHS